MAIEIQVLAPDAIDTDVLAVPVTHPAHELPRAAAQIDERLKGRIARLAEEGELAGELGEAVIVHVEGEIGARRVAAAGLGPSGTLDSDALRTSAAAVARNAKHGGSIGWLLDDSLALPLEDQVRAIVDGTVLGAYSPARWKTEGARAKKIARLAIYTEQDGLGAHAERAGRIAEWTNFARDLVNDPPNELTPVVLGERAAEIADRFEHLRVEVLGPEELERLGARALLAVGSGSHNPPQLIVLRYEPSTPTRPDVHLGLVGKAVTFDSGGLSLKPALYMESMKGDMAGGAAVIAGMAAIADLGVPVRVTAVVAATENLPGGGSFRPGDILTAGNGKTIEVINTDAEGRIILADALWHAREQGATHVLDLATLTGAMELALGDLYAGLFANDAEWRDEILAASTSSGDPVWPWPLHARYRRYIDSNFADMKNASILKQGSPVLAAEFLLEFAGEGAWAHIDMAGPGFFERSRGDYLTQPGGTGFGVRLIADLADRFA